MLKQGKYKTDKGSQVIIFSNNTYNISFDWVEEENANIDSEPEIDFIDELLIWNGGENTARLNRFE